MGEVVGVGALVADDPPPPQLVEGADQLLLADLAGLGEHVGGELPPDGGGDPDQVAGRRREPGEPRLDHRLDPGGHRPSLPRPAVPAGAQHLDHEQRVALGLGEQALGLGVGQLMAGQPPAEGRRLPGREAAELELDELPEGGQPGAERVQGMLVAQVVVAGGGGHQQRGLRPGPEQVVEELEGLGVGPVQVVGDQQQRPARGQQGPGQGVEQPLAPVAVRQRAWGREVGHPGAELGQEPGELAQQGRVQPRQRPGQPLLAQPGHHRPVGERPLGRVGTGLHGRRSLVDAPAAQLLDQPGLARPGLAGDQHQPGRPAGAGPPQVGEAGPLGGPADERRGADRSERVRRPAGGRLGQRRQQGLVCPAGRRRRLDPELPLQGGRAGVVGAQRPGPVPTGVVEPHQHLPGRVAQRVVAQEPLGVADRRGGLAPGLQHLEQPLQDPEVALAEPFPLLQHPVVHPTEVVAGVQLGGLGQGAEFLLGPGGPLGPGQRRLEGGHVQPPGRLVPPAQCPRGHLQEPVGVGQGPAEDVEQVAQVGPGLGLAGVGPEQEGQPLAGLGRLAVEQQVGQQRLGPGRAERRDRDPAVAQVELAEEPDAQPSSAHGSILSNRCR